MMILTGGTMPTARLTSKGQITLPKEIRDRLGLRTGDEVEFREEHGVYLVSKRPGASPFDHYLGYLKHLVGQDPDALVEEMRGE
jgi:AbrB family looped-hinge helix DNA binding protein